MAKLPTIALKAVVPNISRGARATGQLAQGRAQGGEKGERGGGQQAER